MKDWGAKRVFLVTDQFFSERGTAREIAQAAAETWGIFDQVMPDPTAELVARGTARLKAFAPDLVVALGGGSPMDCAKAMVYFSGETVPLAAIPTTSGSGSEVTDFAILTHVGVKHPLVHERLRPQTAILDSELLEELPRSLIADAGFDVLSHALEAAVGRNAGPITDALARDAFRTAYSLLPASYSGDPGSGFPFTWRQPWPPWPFPRLGWVFVTPYRTVWAVNFMSPTDGSTPSCFLPWWPATPRRLGSVILALARQAGLGGSAETVAL